MMRQAGIRWVRVVVDWDAVERRAGEFNFAAYDSLVGSLSAQQLRILLVLDSRHSGFAGAIENHADPQAAFLGFAEQALIRYRGRGILWEMCPEFSLASGSETFEPDRYVPKAVAFAELVQRVSPGERVAGPSTRGFDWRLLESSLQAGLLSTWAAISVRPVGSEPPEARLQDWARLRSLVVRHTPAGGAEVPILATQWGYGEVGEPLEQERQAMYLVRQYLANLVAGVPLSIWSGWKDDSLSPNGTTPQFGTVRHDLRPKPAFSALRQLHGWINGFEYNKRLATSSPSSFRLLFTRGREARIVEWTSERGGTSWLTERPRLARSTSLPAPLMEWRALPLAWEVASPQELGSLLRANLSGLPGGAFVEVTQRLEGAANHAAHEFTSAEADTHVMVAANESRLFLTNPQTPVRFRIRVTVEGQSLAQEVLVHRTRQPGATTP